MNFNNVVKAIYEDQYELQMSILDEIAVNIRKLPSRKIMEDNKMFFLADDYTLPSLVGEYIRDPQLGLYSKYDECMGSGKLWIPIYDFSDDIVGFAWYSDGSTEGDDGGPRIKYKLQRGTFVKNRFLNIRRHTFKQAMQEGYICVTDGFFDKYYLEHYNIPSASLLSSAVSDYRSFYLSFIDHIFLMMDNDEAGVGLADTLRKMYPGKHVTIIKHAVGKDVDDYLKYDPEKQIVHIREAIAKARREPAIWLEVVLPTVA